MFGFYLLIESRIKSWRVFVLTQHNKSNRWRHTQSRHNIVPTFLTMCNFFQAFFFFSPSTVMFSAFWQLPIKTTINFFFCLNFSSLSWLLMTLAFIRWPIQTWNTTLELWLSSLAFGKLAETLCLPIAELYIPSTNRYQCFSLHMCLYQCNNILIWLNAL